MGANAAGTEACAEFSDRRKLLTLAKSVRQSTPSRDKKKRSVPQPVGTAEGRCVLVGRVTV
jgi:hypothetical protein